MHGVPPLANRSQGANGASSSRSCESEESGCARSDTAANGVVAPTRSTSSTSAVLLQQRRLTASIGISSVVIDRVEINTFLSTMQFEGLSPDLYNDLYGTVLGPSTHQEGLERARAAARGAGGPRRPSCHSDSDRCRPKPCGHERGKPEAACASTSEPPLLPSPGRVRRLIAPLSRR